MNLSMLLDMAADGYGDRLMVGRRGDGHSAEELRHLAIGGAALLRERGAEALIYLDVNGPCFPAALFAAARAGVPLVPLNYRLSAEQLEVLLLKHVGAVVIAEERFHSLLERLGLTVFSSQEWLSTVAAAPYRGGAAGDDGSVAEEVDTPAVIIYTSGTTSAPKGVLLRHENLVGYVLGSVEFGGAEAGDASLVSVPPYHIAAVANAVTNLYAGRRCIVLEQFTGEEWLELVRREGVTHALVVPTMLARIIEADTDRSVPSLKTLAYGGAPMPVSVIERAMASWPEVDFVNAYGLTETSSTISVLGPEEHRSAVQSTVPAVRARLGSAGLPVPSVEVEIRGASGEVLGAGTTGHIFVRGQQVSGEYAGIGSVLDERGFFDTRDEGYLDDAGYLFIGGRTDDTIIRGGENIAPAEIEERLLAHGDIADAVVVGVPDEEWGQRLEAAVVPRAGRTVDVLALRDYAREHLRGSKTPDRIVVWDVLPRNDVGKLIRREALKRMQCEGEDVTAG
jgi:acyl-CoA synthetase (AMP-forming)/AMP-acid ligase II